MSSGPTMSMSVSIQRFTLPAGQESARIALDETVFTEELWGWKTISFVRNKPTWVEAKTYSTLRDHANLASSLVLLKSPNWSHTLSLYPVSTLAANCNLIVDPTDSKVYMNVRRCQPGIETEVYVVRGRTTGSSDAGKVVKVAVDAARQLVGGKRHGGGSDYWNGLGICTWESFGKRSGRPTKDTLLTLIPSFPIKSFLIDDGWQDVVAKGQGTEGTLKSFHAYDGMGAPMKEVVDALKAKGIEEVGVWMTLQGYWNSIDKNSPLVQKYDCRSYKSANRDQVRGGVNDPLHTGARDDQWLPSPEKAAQFWLDWFTEMKSWGIDFVKVDNQATHDQVVGPGAWHVQQAMWSGMLTAAEKVWGTTERVIMCMSHNERMLNGPGGLGSDRPAGDLIFRNSDDFNLEYEERHTDYVQFNIYGSILTSQLSLIPDFDMFATAPEGKWPTYHAFLRALSPGPTLVSDTPDVTTDQSIIDRLTSKVKGGAVRAVKADSPATALPGRWFWDNLQGPADGPAMLAYVKVPAAHGSIIGAWNCRSATTQSWAKDKLSLQDVEESLEVDNLDGEYVLWSIGLTGRSDKYQLIGPGDKVNFKIQLARAECEGIVVAKVWNVGGTKLAVLGMLDKYAPLGQLKVTAEKSELVVKSPFEAGITLLALNDVSDLKAAVDGQSTPIERSSAFPSGSLLLTIKPQSGGKSGDYEIRLSV